MKEKIFRVFAKGGVPVDLPCVQSAVQGLDAMVEAIKDHRLISASELDFAFAADALGKASGRRVEVVALPLTTGRWKRFWGPCPVYTDSFASALAQRFRDNPDSIGLRHLVLETEKAVFPALEGLFSKHSWTRRYSIDSDLRSTEHVAKNSVAALTWHTLVRAVYRDESGVESLLPALKLMRYALPLGELQEEPKVWQILVAS